MWILAIDIGGTAIKCGLVNSQGERRQLTQFPMNKEYATVTQRICRHIDAFYAATFDGIAISSTGLVDPRSQEIGIHHLCMKDLAKDWLGICEAHTNVQWLPKMMATVRYWQKSG